MMSQSQTLYREGNIDLQNIQISGYLCSRKISATSILRSYDWAIAQAKAGTCVIGGFHSRIEKDVLHFLLKGDQPLIIVLARGFYKRWQPEIKARLDRGNLLIISPFEQSVTAVTPQTCLIRNKLILELVDQIVIGYADPKGQLAKLLAQTDKPVRYLDQSSPADEQSTCE
jgi:predicted Rossmann fold nucleotide-binding protein DprA/Smf involved in DNA uptake